MIQTLPISKAREDLTSLVANARSKFNEYIITVNGSPAAVLISANEYESWKETNDIMADQALLKAIRMGEKEIKQGKGIPWEKIKEELDLD